MARAGRPSIRDRVRQRAEENKHTGGSSYLKLPEGVSFFKVQKSTRQDPTRLDIVPFEVSKNCIIPDGKSKEMELQKGDLWYCRTIFVHRGIGAEEKAYLCPRTIKKPCPICEERARLSKDPNCDEKTLNALKPQVKDIFNVDDPKEGIRILEFSHACFRENLEKEIREGKEEWAGFADLEGGYSLDVVFSEETFGGSNKYLEATRFDFEPRDDYKESILDKAVDLNDCLVVLPYEKLERIFLELDSEPESEGAKEEVEEKPEPRASRKAAKEEVKEERTSRRKKEPEPEPEPEEEEEEEEEATPPAKEERSGRRGRREEEEAPKRGTKEKNPCPSGHVFGEDTNAKPECQKCENKDWEACQDKYDELHPRKGKK